MANKTTGASFSDLLTAFETDESKIEKRMGIKDKVTMPVPNGDNVSVRLLWSKDDAGQPIAVMRKENVAFRNGVAFFMTCELVDKVGEKQISLSKSLFGSMAAAAKERNLAFEDLVLKAGDISAAWFTAAPRESRRGKCLTCGGVGCKACTVTGTGKDAGITTGLQTPVVYNFHLRDDLMSAVNKADTASAASKF
jgi:hypothetical protein